MLGSVARCSCFFFFSSRRRHTRCGRDWSSDVCSSDLLERRLGRTAGWLPFGRTRREAGRIAFRLALRSALLDLHEAVAAFATALATREDEHAATLWVDTTYLQPAQPSTFGHYLGSFAREG